MYAYILLDLSSGIVPDFLLGALDTSDVVAFCLHVEGAMALNMCTGKGRKMSRMLRRGLSLQNAIAHLRC
jgi:hypothetical protein